MCTALRLLALLTLSVGLAHSWDLALIAGDLLEFYTNATKTETVRLNSKNLSVLAYDEVHNMMLYVDKQSNNDAIVGYDISTSQYRYLTKRNGRNIRDLAFDPATEVLFYTVTNDPSIYWITLKPGFKTNGTGNVLIKMDVGIPTEIAVDSCRGHIYWINTNLTTPTIERARYNGSEREVVINSRIPSTNTTYKLEPHSLAIDQQTQKIYWIESETSKLNHICQADLNGKNKDNVVHYTINTGVNRSELSNRFAISEKTLFLASLTKEYKVFGFLKTEVGMHNGRQWDALFTTNTMPTGIAANYKILEHIKGENCEVLTSMVQNNSVTNNPFRTATEYYDGPFCVHGLKVDGQSLCQCTPGYTGERCDVSLCENYCVQGNCSFSDEGLPKCRCNVGYTGARCEVNPCFGYCLNDGDCTLNEKSEPVCQCKGGYLGDRCDVSLCLNYCFNGHCSYSDEGLLTCSCDAGYSGERCEIDACYGYCLNNGACSLNEEKEPFCQCVGDYEGPRCEAVKNDITTCSIDGNLTLPDILSNSRTPISKLSLVVEYR